MIIDSNKFDSEYVADTDICIVGGGLAGITLAKELLHHGLKVYLIESGGIKPDKATQNLQWGNNVGHPYFSLDTARPRFLGGSLNRWHLKASNECCTARMRPLDAIDFEERDWVPNSGWPFPKEHLDPFYDRAQTICEIEPAVFNTQYWEDTQNRSKLQFIDSSIETVIFKFGSRYSFLERHLSEIVNENNATVCTYGNVVEIELDQVNNCVSRLRVATIEGKRWYIKARIFVLAAGAIETARLLLTSNRIRTSGIGNDYDIVGRYFMEHPHSTVGFLVPDNQNLFDFTSFYNKIHNVNGVPIIGKLSLMESVLRSEKLLSQVVELVPIKMRKTRLHRFPIINPNKLRFLYRRLKSRFLGLIDKSESGIFALNSMSEQIPNPLSRVMLSEKKDELGINRINLDWQMTSQDIHSIMKTLDFFDDSCRKSGIGKVYGRIHDVLPNKSIHGGWHHMGTTRMNPDPNLGVVDVNTKLHSVENLFIAGPSVFPTGGYANPSLTIVALSIRLADHLKSLFSATRNVK